MFTRVAAERLLARTMSDPVRAGVVASDNPVLSSKVVLLLGGACWRGVVEVADLGLKGLALMVEWEAAIERVHRRHDLLFTDGSRN